MSFNSNHLKLATISDSLACNCYLPFHKTITIIMCSSQLGKVIWSFLEKICCTGSHKQVSTAISHAGAGGSAPKRCQQCQQLLLFSPCQGTPARGTTCWPKEGDPYLGLACVCGNFSTMSILAAWNTLGLWAKAIQQDTKKFVSFSPVPSCVFFWGCRTS